MINQALEATTELKTTSETFNLETNADILKLPVLRETITRSKTSRFKSNESQVEEIQTNAEFVIKEHSYALNSSYRNFYVNSSIITEVNIVEDNEKEKMDNKSQCNFLTEKDLTSDPIIKEEQNEIEFNENLLDLPSWGKKAKELFACLTESENVASLNKYLNINPSVCLTKLEDGFSLGGIKNNFNKSKNNCTIKHSENKIEKLLKTRAVTSKIVVGVQNLNKTRELSNKKQPKRIKGKQLSLKTIMHKQNSTNTKNVQGKNIITRLNEAIKLQAHFPSECKKNLKYFLSNNIEPNKMFRKMEKSAHVETSFQKVDEDSEISLEATGEDIIKVLTSKLEVKTDPFRSESSASTHPLPISNQRDLRAEKQKQSEIILGKSHVTSLKLSSYQTRNILKPESSYLTDQVLSSTNIQNETISKPKTKSEFIDLSTFNEKKFSNKRIMGEVIGLLGYRKFEDLVLEQNSTNYGVVTKFEPVELVYILDDLRDVKMDELPLGLSSRRTEIESLQTKKKTIEQNPEKSKEDAYELFMSKERIRKEAKSEQSTRLAAFDHPCTSDQSSAAILNDYSILDMLNVGKKEQFKDPKSNSTRANVEAGKSSLILKNKVPAISERKFVSSNDLKCRPVPEDAIEKKEETSMKAKPGLEESLLEFESEFDIATNPKLNSTITRGEETSKDGKRSKRKRSYLHMNNDEVVSPINIKAKFFTNIAEIKTTTNKNNIQSLGKNDVVHSSISRTRKKRAIKKRRNFENCNHKIEPDTDMKKIGINTESVLLGFEKKSPLEPKVGKTISKKVQINSNLEILKDLFYTLKVKKNAISRKVNASPNSTKRKTRLSKKQCPPKAKLQVEKEAIPIKPNSVLPVSEETLCWETKLEEAISKIVEVSPKSKTLKGEDASYSLEQHSCALCNLADFNVNSIAKKEKQNKGFAKLKSGDSLKKIHSDVNEIEKLNVTKKIKNEDLKKKMLKKIKNKEGNQNEELTNVSVVNKTQMKNIIAKKNKKDEGLVKQMKNPSIVGVNQMKSLSMKNEDEGLKKKKTDLETQTNKGFHIINYSIVNVNQMKDVDAKKKERIEVCVKQVKSPSIANANQMKNITVKRKEINEDFCKQIKNPSVVNVNQMKIFNAKMNETNEGCVKQMKIPSIVNVIQMKSFIVNNEENENLKIMKTGNEKQTDKGFYIINPLMSNVNQMQIVIAKKEDTNEGRVKQMKNPLIANVNQMMIVVAKKEEKGEGCVKQMKNLSIVNVNQVKSLSAKNDENLKKMKTGKETQTNKRFRITNSIVNVTAKKETAEGCVKQMKNLSIVNVNQVKSLSAKNEENDENLKKMKTGKETQTNKRFRITNSIVNVTAKKEETAEGCVKQSKNSSIVNVTAKKEETAEGCVKQIKNPSIANVNQMKSVSVRNNKHEGLWKAEEEKQTNADFLKISSVNSVLHFLRKFRCSMCSYTSNYETLMKCHQTRTHLKIKKCVRKNKQTKSFSIYNKIKRDTAHGPTMQCSTSANTDAGALNKFKVFTYKSDLESGGKPPLYEVIHGKKS